MHSVFGDGQRLAVDDDGLDGPGRALVRDFGQLEQLAGCGDLAWRAQAGAKAAAKSAAKPTRPSATLTLSSKNYSSWSLRGWLLCKFAGIAFDELMVSPDDADARKELLLLAPSIRVPCLTHEGAKVW